MDDLIWYLSEDWWMKTIIAACITSGVTLIGFFINYLVQQKKDFSEMSKEHRNNLSDTKRCIKETGNTISDSLKETQINVRANIKDVQTDMRENIRDVQSEVKTVQTSINDIEKMLIEEKTASQYRYDNMQDKQQMLHSSLQNLQDMYRELQRVLLENDRLQEENIQLKEDVEQLKAYILSKQPKEKDRYDDEFER